MNTVWYQTLTAILRTKGREVSPRGKLTREIPQHTVEVDMRRPVLTVPGRKLSYRFMAAEAFWILSGSNTVAGIAPWNKHIAEFSDDGETFFGAYGPKVIGQLDYVVRKLIEDKDTRQAGLTIWRENPPQTKDVPCTVAIFANIRDNKLNVHVFMRSSDVWLGLPYDVFNFSMIGHLICCRLNAHESTSVQIEPGTLYLTAASSHMYQPQWVDALSIIDNEYRHAYMSDTPPTRMRMYQDERQLMQDLQVLRESSPGDGIRWWEPNAPR